MQPVLVDWLIHQLYQFSGNLTGTNQSKRLRSYRALVGLGVKEAKKWIRVRMLHANQTILQTLVSLCEPLQGVFFYHESAYHNQQISTHHHRNHHHHPLHPPFHVDHLHFRTLHYLPRDRRN